jgi:hypothetical protein
VLPHSLFMGGVQLDVQEVLEEEASRNRPAHELHLARNHA